MTLSYRQRRRWGWRIAHAWSIVRLQRRLVLAIAILGTVVSVVITAAATPIYSAILTFDPVELLGGSTNQPRCY